MNQLFIFEMQSWYNTYDQQGNHRNNNVYLMIQSFFWHAEIPRSSNFGAGTK